MSDRARRIGRLVEWVAHRPVPVLIVCTLLAIIGAGSAITSMGFKSDRSDLVDPSLDWQRRYREFKETFPNWDDAIVVVHHRGQPDQALAFFETLDRSLHERGFEDRTLWIESDEANPNAILFEDEDRFAEALEALRRSAPLLSQGTTLESALRSAQRIGAEDQLVSLVRAALEGVDTVLEANGPRRELIDIGGTYAIGFVALDTSENGDSVNDVASGVRDLREAIVEAEPVTSFNVDVGVTGIPVIESDETAQSTLDAALASALSFVLIASLLAWVYRGVAVPLCALGALLIGVAWSFGWLMIGVGHLQVLSVVFAIVLLGLGVDGAIHLIARLELVHPDHDHLPGAIGKAATGVGPGILTGTLTTAFAFGATALSPFTGVAEIGLIAAGGVVLCTLAILVALPALLALLKHPERHLRTRAGGASRPYAGRLGLWIDRHPWKIFSASAIVITLASLCTSGVLTDPIRYDPDLIALMPPNAEGVKWERRLREADERSSWHAIVVAEDRHEAERLTQELGVLGTVDRVGGAGLLFPGEGMLGARAERLRSLPDPPMTIDAPPVTDERAGVLRALLAPYGIEACDEDLVRTLRAFQSDRVALADRLRALRSVESFVLADDLPPDARERFIAPSGEYLLRVYPAPKGDLGPLHPDRLGPFVEEVLRVAPGATGPAVQVHESTRVILDGYVRAAIYAAIAIVVLLLIDFRSLADTLCALMPVLVGIALLLGVMAALSIPLNFANTIVMPLIIGLGVDAGVHAVHRWRMQPHDAPAGLAGGTGRAITLTSLTTAIGFACMMLAEHRGVRSLGLVMTLGLALTWVASVFVLPPLLRLRTKKEPVKAP